jgi:hypothetical protein
MTRDEIIELAREAGFVSAEYWPDDFRPLFGCVERFAALVATAEREECAKVCEAGIDMWPNEYHEEWNDACENRAAAIRARGQDEVVKRQAV